MADFTNNQIKNTYQRVLQHDLSGVVQNGTGSADLGDIHISGSLYHTGSAVISNNLRVLGNVTAQQFIATTVSSSIVYESGSSQFGNSIDDTHQFYGSTLVTGSLVVDNGTFNNRSEARGSGSLAVGAFALAQGTFSVAIGNNVTASGAESFAQGINLHASGDGGAHAEGGDTLASGYRSHAEGYATTASGFQAHSEGEDTLASGIGSHAEGIGTVASANYQHVEGKYNVTSSTAIKVIGNGTSDSDRHNILEVEQDQIYMYGGLASITSNPSTINDNSIIPANHNSRMYGPITVAAGKTLTVAANAKLEITDI